MKQELDFVNVEPAAGSSFSVSGTGTVNIQFNLPVTVGKASITANGTTARVGVSSSGSYISVDLATALTRWLENSTIKKVTNSHSLSMTSNRQPMNHFITATASTLSNT